MENFQTGTGSSFMPSNKDKSEEDGQMGAEAVQSNENFGGLVLGYSGTEPDTVPNSTNYRNLIFTPGTNLGPEYPKDLRMTSSCSAVLRRGNDGAGLHAKFDPPLPNASKEADITPPKLRYQPHPCEWLPECVPEGANPEDHHFEPTNNMFLFFGPNAPAEPARPAYCPPVFQTTEAAVFDYFEAYNIEAMMEYFVTLLCIHLPEDPFAYIESLCGQLLKCRTSTAAIDTVDHVFQPSHLLAMFSLFDKQERKFVTVEQYKSAMDMLGITRYNPQPSGYAQDIITEDVFFEETSKALDVLLKSFIG